MSHQTRENEDFCWGYRKALSLESIDPARALAEYKKLEKNNKIFVPEIVYAAILGPVIAGLVAYYITRNMTQFQSATALTIILLGYSPVWQLASRYMVRLGVPEATGAMRGFMNIFMPFMILFGDAVALMVVATMSLLTFVPFLVMVNVFAYFRNGPPFEAFALTDSLFLRTIGGIAFVFWLLYVLADLHPKEIIAEPKGELLAVIPAGLKYKSGDIIQFFGGVLMASVLVGAGPWGLLYSSPGETLAAMAISGLMLGWNLSRLERDIEAKNLISLGVMRCCARLGKYAEVRYRAMQIDTAPSTGKNKAMERMAWALHLYASPQRRTYSRERIALQIQHAQEYLGSHWEVWEASLARVRELTAA